MKRIVPYIIFIFVALILIIDGNSYGLHNTFHEHDIIWQIWSLPIGSFYMHDILVLLFVGIFVPSILNVADMREDNPFIDHGLEYFVLLFGFIFLLYVYPGRIILELLCDQFGYTLPLQSKEINSEGVLAASLELAMGLGLLIAILCKIFPMSKVGMPDKINKKEVRRAWYEYVVDISLIVMGLILIMVVPSSSLLFISLGTILPGLFFAILIRWYFDIIWTRKNDPRHQKNESK